MIRLALVALAIIDTHLLLQDRWGPWVWLADAAVLGVALLLRVLGFFPTRQPSFSDSAYLTEKGVGGAALPPLESPDWEIGDPVRPWEKVYAFLVLSVLPVFIALGVCITAFALIQDAMWWVQVLPLLVLSAYVAHHMLQVGIVALLVGPVLRVDPETELYPDLVLAWLVGTLSSLTALFVGWTAFWVNVDVLDISDSRSSAFASACALYLWYIADAVPVLEIPETIQWERPTSAAGPLAAGLALAFKATVTIPIVAGLAATLYAIWRRQVVATREAE